MTTETGLTLFKTVMETDHPIQTVNATSTKDTSNKDMIWVPTDEPQQSPGVHPTYDGLLADFPA